MSWHTIFRKSNGALRGHGSGDTPTLPAELDSITTADRKDQTHDWDAGTTSWIIKPPKRHVSVGEFLDRFRPPELLAFYREAGAGSSAFDRFIRFRELAGGRVHLDAPQTGTIMDGLVTDNVITAQRKTAILS